MRRPRDTKAVLCVRWNMFLGKVGMSARVMLFACCVLIVGQQGVSATPDAGSSQGLVPGVLLVADAQPSKDAAQLKALGDQMLATGDLTTARLYYSRASELGSAPAAAAMGTTYDPAYFSQWQVRGVAPDTAAAATWYRKAIALGDKDAADKLNQLPKTADAPNPAAGQEDTVSVDSNAAPAATATPETALSALSHASTPPVEIPAMPAAGLTQASVEFILNESHANFHLVPREEFKVDLPDINYAWMTSDQVFGAVIQANTSQLHPEDAAPAFITKINAGCAGIISMKIGAIQELKGSTTTREAESECQSNTGDVKINYAFVQNRPALTVFISMSGNNDAAVRHRDAILATVRKMILAAN
jgi:hypothetical protein